MLQWLNDLWTKFGDGGRGGGGGRGGKDHCLVNYCIDRIVEAEGDKPD